MTVEQVIVNICKNKVASKARCYSFDIDVPPRHMFSLCQFKLADKLCEIFDTLPSLKDKVRTGGE